MALAAAAAEVPPFPWVEALRSERWGEALSLIELSPTATQARAEVRYAAAAAAEGVGDAAKVVQLLEGLETSLPQLADRIRERRARAALTGGNAAETLSYFGARRDREGRWWAARAEETLGHHEKARRLLEALVAQSPKRGNRCAIEAPARLLLASILSSGHAELARRQWRTVAVEAPLCDGAEEAAERLEALGPKHALSASERRARAQTLADAGQLEKTEAELSRLAKLKALPLAKGEQAYLRGWVRYNARRELGLATDLLSQAAKRDPKRRAELYYYAGRAATREGATDRGLEKYDLLLKAYAKSGYAEAAEYQRAQLLYSAGRFDDAIRAYDAYLASRGKHARFSDDVLDERAIARLAAGRAKEATTLLDDLATKAKDLGAKGRYLELKAVALERSGSSEEGRALLGRVIKDYPLSFAALASAARLRALGAPVPPAFADPGAPGTSHRPAQVALPERVALLHRLGLDREAERALSEVEASLAKANADRAEEVLCAAYGRLEPAEREYRVGQRAATWRELLSAPTASNRWLWECVYPRPYSGVVGLHASSEGLEPELIYAVMRQESAFRPEVVSPAQAVGLLQILPSTGARVAGELAVPFSPERLIEPSFNLRLGARYLKKLLEVFQGNLALAAASYNAGPSTVLGWVQGAGSLDLDLFVARIPYVETRSYVERVVGNYARYRYMQGGEDEVPRLDLSLPEPRADGVELY